MRIKLDENITVLAADVLSRAGHHDVHSVPDEAITGAPDAALWSVCQREHRMLVTFDLGFGDVRSYPPGTHYGVVLLRLTDQQPDVVLDVLRRFLATHDLDALAGCLVVVDDHRVRIRHA